jgi:biopolymer transport protein ExbB/TolQ
MAIDGPTATVIASLITAAVVLAISGVNVVFRLGKLEQGAEAMEKALAKHAGDTEKALAVAASNTEKALAAAAADTDRRFDRLEEIIRTEQDATRAEIRRLAEALASHTHDADGTTIFRIPPVNP